MNSDPGGSMSRKSAEWKESEAKFGETATWKWSRDEEDPTSDDALTKIVGYLAFTALFAIYAQTKGARTLAKAVYEAAFYAVPYVFLWACWRVRTVNHLGLLMGVFSIIITLATTVAKRVFGSGKWEVYDMTTGRTDLAYKEMDKVTSRMWAFHGCAALLWLACATWSIALTRRASKKAHRNAGICAMVALCIHTCGAAGNLVVDFERHSPLNKFLLGGSIVGTWVDVLTGMACMRRGDRQGHRFHMLAAFVSSMDGAGTIRLVALLQNHMNFGVLVCQVQLGRVGGNCDWLYTSRMLMVMLVRKYKLLCAARAIGDKKRVRVAAIGFATFAISLLLEMALTYAGVVPMHVTLAAATVSCLTSEWLATVLYHHSEDPVQEYILTPLAAAWMMKNSQQSIKKVEGSYPVTAANEQPVLRADSSNPPAAFQAAAGKPAKAEA